jgi:hypothetical protein
MFDWLMTPKRPRSKSTCDYCDSSKWGLVRRRTAHGTFCKLACEEAYLKAVYRQIEEPKRSVGYDVC